MREEDEGKEAKDEEKKEIISPLNFILLFH
jgi:hypothetical protein